MWRLLTGAALVAAGIVALIEDHRYRPEYGCTAHTLRTCERGEGLYPLPIHIRSAWDQLRNPERRLVRTAAE